MQTPVVQNGSNVIQQAATASLGARLVAFVIDGFLLSVYLVVIGSIFLSSDIEDLFMWSVFVVIPLLFYTMIFEISMNGQTPGKRAMQICVVSLDGSSASSGQLVVRWFFLIAGFYFLSGVIAAVIVLANGNGQRLGDIIAGTKVVKVEARESISDQVYIPKFPMVKLLGADDIALIERALNADREFDNRTPIEMVTRKIKSLLAIETDLPASEFLSALVSDYKQRSES
jgi:uncharacterized RDD family membrane protein YckC